MASLRLVERVNQRPFAAISTPSDSFVPQPRCHRAFCTAKWNRTTLCPDISRAPATSGLRRVRRVGFEPTTFRVKAGCSSVELATRNRLALPWSLPSKPSPGVLSRYRAIPGPHASRSAPDRGVEPRTLGLEDRATRPACRGGVCPRNRTSFSRASTARLCQFSLADVRAAPRSRTEPAALQERRRALRHGVLRAGSRTRTCGLAAPNRALCQPKLYPR